MKFFTLFFILILYSALSFAQKYYPGYAVKNNGDTVKGYIKYKRWDYNPAVIEFKPEPQAKSSPSKGKLVIMLAAFTVVAIMTFSVMHK